MSVMAHCWGTLVGVVFGSLVSTEAGEQVIYLNKGWNSVFLELEPEHSKPAQLFAGKPVEMVSLWIPTEAKVLSLTDPLAEVGKLAEWHTWQPASSSSAFLNNLQAIPSRTPLLIKVSSACEITVTGDFIFERVKWEGASFNLVGFDIDSAAPPTFGRFFDGSHAHKDLKVYRLISNHWQRVAPTELMARGEAYWIWCEEGSDFQGPVDMNLAGEGLSVAGGAGGSKLRLRKNGSLPVTLVPDFSEGLAGFGFSSSAIEIAPTHFQLELGEHPTGYFLKEGSSEAGSSGTLQLRGAGMLFRVPVVSM